jgi:exopolyphosphatase/guanosine-5'-triphosphate,3'-diphosphate pyrophosphatase
VREASNSKAFVDAVEEIMGAKVTVLSGAEEAHFASLGAISGMPGFVGVVGDLGGGSLELSSIADGTDSTGETHELGVIRLQDDSESSPSKTQAIAKQRLKKSKLLDEQGGSFCAIGGTWRSLAKVHQVLRDYPLHMVQHYSVKASDMLKLCEDIVAATAANRLRSRELRPARSGALRCRGDDRGAEGGQVRQRSVFGAGRARGLSLWPARRR